MKKINTKQWIREFKEVFVHVVHNKAGRRNREPINQQYSFSTTLLSIVFILALFAFVGGIFTPLGQEIGHQIAAALTGRDAEPYTYTVSTPEQKEKNQTPLNVGAEEDSNGEMPNCLSGGSWSLWLGRMSRDVGDDTHYFLPLDSYRGLFKHGGEVKKNPICVFEFVPRGKHAINYVISFDEFYQVVIGDNDRRTISLRASGALGESLKPVEEDKTQKTRPKLNYPIKDGSRVLATLSHIETQEGRYRVEISISYTSETFNNTELEKFYWEFTPSPVVRLRSLSLSLGLIRGLSDTSHIGVSFVDPKLQK